MTEGERKKYLETAKNFTSQEFQVFIVDFLIKILEEVKGIRREML